MFLARAEPIVVVLLAQIWQTNADRNRVLSRVLDEGVPLKDLVESLGYGSSLGLFSVLFGAFYANETSARASFSQISPHVLDKDCSLVLGHEMG
jgi:hypothetical protein